MHTVQFALALAVALSLQSISKLSAASDNAVSCLRGIAEANLAAKLTYQRDLRDLIVERRPEFTELADINRDVQVLFAEMRFARQEHLLATAPDRLDSENGLSSFSNFRWTDEDLEALKAARPEYIDMIARLEMLKAKNQGHPDWPEMRAFVRGEMSEGGSLAQITADFLAQGTKLERQLSECQSH